MDAHRLVRTGGVAAAGLTALLVLAGCGGGPAGDGGRDATGAPAAGATAGGHPPASPAPSPTPTPSAPPVTAGAVEGSWVGLTDGRPVSLTVKKGHALVLADAHVCQGTARGTGPVTLSLTCDDGYTTRTKGTAATTRDTLVVTWSGGTKDTLAKAAPPQGTPSLVAPPPSTPPTP
ncbi:hypothetical protein [Streptomyces ficellus]|uniref:Uncharacterized protein n=1 Tax=Streptomyces ficellus TaxID=1977088 RepID=A0A6I6FE72_9ACTN|nr:hypothetical protein [Streptomyces ficellus]QGV79307.1 hypothetical protein EIZ62_14345 [Streptomyces ficellus]